MVAVSSVGVAPTWTVGSSASIFFLCSTKPRRFFMMAYNNVDDKGIKDSWKEDMEKLMNEVNHAIYPAVVCRCFLPGLRGQPHMPT